MIKTKFMTRIFSAIENDETAVLEQLDKDLDIAKEDGSCEGDQYVITASDDKVILHDKVNNEDTEIIEDENGEVTFSKVDLDEDAPDNELNSAEEKDFNEMSDEEFDKTIEFSSVKSSRIKKFSLESLKSFAKGGWRDGKLYIKMGDNDVALDLKNKVAIIIDENLSCPIDPKKSFIDNLTTVEKFMKDNDLKVFSETSDNYEYWIAEYTYSGPDYKVVKVNLHEGHKGDKYNDKLKLLYGPFDSKDKADQELDKIRNQNNLIGLFSDPSISREVVNKDNKFSKFSPAVAKMFSKLSISSDDALAIGCALNCLSDDNCNYSLELRTKHIKPSLSGSEIFNIARLVIETANLYSDIDKSDIIPLKKFSKFSPAVAKMFSNKS